MATTDHGADASAIVIPMRVPAAITPLRERWGRAAAAGAAPHVTILYPFMPASSLDTSVRAALAEIVGTVQPFDVRFAKTHQTASHGPRGLATRCGWTSANSMADPAGDQTVMSSRCSPQVSRRRSLISPTVA